MAAMEEEGLVAARKTGFVLVAGGLGSASATKVSSSSYGGVGHGQVLLELYVDYVLAVQDRAHSGDSTL